MKMVERIWLFLVYTSWFIMLRNLASATSETTLEFSDEEGNALHDVRGTMFKVSDVTRSNATDPTVPTSSRNAESVEQMRISDSSASVEASNPRSHEAPNEAVTNAPGESESNTKTLGVQYEESLERTAKKWGATIEFFQNDLAHEFFKAIERISLDIATHSQILLSETCRDESPWNCWTDAAPTKTQDQHSRESCSHSLEDRNAHSAEFATLVARFEEANRAAVLAKDSALNFAEAFTKLFHVLVGDVTHPVRPENPSGRNLPFRKPDEDGESEIASTKEKVGESSVVSSNTIVVSTDPPNYQEIPTTDSANVTGNPTRDVLRLTFSLLDSSPPESGETFQVEQTVLLSTSVPEQVSEKSWENVTGTLAANGQSFARSSETTDKDIDTSSIRPGDEVTTESSIAEAYLSTNSIVSKTDTRPDSTAATTTDNFGSSDSNMESATESPSSIATDSTTTTERESELTSIYNFTTRRTNLSRIKNSTKPYSQDILSKKRELRKAIKTGIHSSTIRTLSFLRDYGVLETDLPDFEALPNFAKLSFRHKVLQIRARVEDRTYAMVANGNGTLTAIKLEDGKILDGDDLRGSKWSFKFEAGPRGGAIIKSGQLHHGIICAGEDSTEDSGSIRKVPSGSVILSKISNNNSNFCKWMTILVCKKELQPQIDGASASNELGPPSLMNGLQLECHLELRNEGAPDWIIGVDSTGSVHLEEIAQMQEGDKLELVEIQ